MLKTNISLGSCGYFQQLLIRTVHTVSGVRKHTNTSRT